jgi:hypothetical protein
VASVSAAMKTKTKVILITSACTIAAIALGSNTPLGEMVWPAQDLHTPPTSAQVPAFIAVSLIEAVAFGLGVSFLIYGYPSVRQRTGSTREAVAVYLSIAWLLVSWFPHDNLQDRTSVV